MIRTLFAVAALTVVALAAASPHSALAGGGCHQSGGLTDESTVEVSMIGACFQPNVVRVNTGDTITWTNDDEQPHTVTGVGQAFGSTEEIAAGGSVSATFDDAGVFPYYCIFHPAMAGAVVVGDGVPGGNDAAAAAITSDGGDDGGASTSTIAGIIAAIGVSGAAVGLVGNRVLSSRKSRAVTS